MSSDAVMGYRLFPQARLPYIRRQVISPMPLPLPLFRTCCNYKVPYGSSIVIKSEPIFPTIELPTENFVNDEIPMYSKILDKSLRELLVLSQNNLQKSNLNEYLEEYISYNKFGERNKYTAELEPSRDFSSISEKAFEIETEIMNEIMPALLPQLDVSISVDTISENEIKHSGDGGNALQCAQLECTEAEIDGAVCASNHNTGNTVSFRNECDVKKHNCRYNTAFKTILREVCPWQFESRTVLDETIAAMEDAVRPL